ncbi:hypothetical protein K437DRAFT_254837 [Tilletiaria anomala UBC 951]|uniref:Protein kinase domain-containing protein n=1 Tax=Tilletiaria anomala (strain ATCC 24038 / CBS 436.72 / UBC 951) TaxID=1037660 RepID=A0A066WK80_TILAU|nr:uncharacterized protein K437DRAFT_254837 [Tilletiaria anomala UBC 951]KDN51424.1 hypothetical protein K437DRAFT_254837 [Tilletiaria anomala UBC 951]
MESGSRIPAPSRILRHSRSRTEGASLSKRSKGAALLGNVTPDHAGNALTLAPNMADRSVSLTGPTIHHSAASTALQPSPYSKTSASALPPSSPYRTPAKRKSLLLAAAAQSGSASTSAARNRSSSTGSAFSSHTLLTAEPMSSRSASALRIEAAEEKLQHASALFDFARKRPQGENQAPGCQQTPSKSAPDLSRNRQSTMSKLALRDISSPSLPIGERDAEWTDDVADVDQSPAHMKAHRLAHPGLFETRHADRSRVSFGSSSFRADDSGLAFVTPSSAGKFAANAPTQSTPQKDKAQGTTPKHLGVLGAQGFGPRQRSSLANEAFTGDSSDAGSAASSPSAAPSSARSQRTAPIGCQQLYPAESPLKKHPVAQESIPKFSTPQFKNVKPLQAAFMSTGLVSKRNRPRGDLADLSGEYLQPLPPRPNFNTSSAAAIGLREVVAAASAHHAISAANTSVMPDTPVKKPAPTTFKPPASLRTHLGIPERPPSRSSSDSPSPVLLPHSPLLKDSCDSPTLGLMSVDQHAFENSAAKGWPTLDASGTLERSHRPKKPAVRPALSRTQAFDAATPAASISGLAAANDSHFTREPSSFLANRQKFMNHRSRPLSVQGLQRKTSMTTEQAAATFSGNAASTATDGGPTPSPGLGMSLGMGMGIAPVPMTPTRNHTPIKWFEAAQLVTTPSPTSHSNAKERERERARSRNVRSPLLLLASPRQGVNVSKFQSSFNVQSVLGTGEFSEVLKVEDKTTGYISAVKRMKKAFGGPRDRLRRMEEVDILRHLQHDGQAHRNVINLLDAWEEGGHLFLQTELCGLGTLAFFLEEYGCMAGNLDEPRLWKILAELSAGLQHIHGNGVLHLDLKPANVLITEVGSLKVGDFGFATRWPLMPAAATLKGAGVHAAAPIGDGDDELVPVRRRGKKQSLEREGDREYLAPEIMSKGRYGKEADMFSLGLIMLEAGGNVVLPDNGEPWLKLRNDDFTDVDLSHLSDQLVELIFAMLDSRPEARPSIDDIVQHPVMRAVQRRMALGVMNSELDQLPDFELPTIESGPLIGLVGDGDDQAMDTSEDLLPPSQSAPAMRQTLSALGLSFADEDESEPRKVMDIRGALIAEPQEEFLDDILSCSNVWEAAGFPSPFEVQGPMKVPLSDQMAPRAPSLPRDQMILD